MEQRFKSLSLFEFREQFPDTDSCHRYLAKIKWQEGYSCRKCGHDRYCKGVLHAYLRQCTTRGTEKEA